MVHPNMIYLEWIFRWPHSKYKENRAFIAEKVKLYISVESPEITSLWLLLYARVNEVYRFTMFISAFMHPVCSWSLRCI